MSRAMIKLLENLSVSLAIMIAVLTILIINMTSGTVKIKDKMSNRTPNIFSYLKYTLFTFLRKHKLYLRLQAGPVVQRIE